MWCGVPMICYPFMVDQPANRKLIVEDWKIGVDFCDGGEVKRDEVAKKFDFVMKGETCFALRESAKKVRETLRNALGKDGSSSTNFDQFVFDLEAQLYAIKEKGSVE
ncbi:hypothetical protein ACS0TY_023787 [Phlomoides rotata]